MSDETNKNWLDELTDFDNVDQLIDDYIFSNTSTKRDIIEIDGVSVKSFHFLSRNKKINPTPPKFDLKNIDGNNYLNISVRKDDLEDQLNTNQINANDLSDSIRMEIKGWLVKKFSNLGRPLKMDKDDTTKLHLFLRYVSICFDLFFRGTEIEEAVKLLTQFREPDLADDEIVLFNPQKIVYKEVNHLSIDISSYDKSKHVKLSLHDLISEIKPLITKFESIVSRSLPQYIEYVGILQHLNNSNYDFKKHSSRPPRSYGLHQENADWIIETFHSTEDKGYSQNKSVEIVQELYKAEFNGISIGKSTILRAVGRM